MLQHVLSFCFSPSNTSCNMCVSIPPPPPFLYFCLNYECLDSVNVSFCSRIKSLPDPVKVSQILISCVVRFLTNGHVELGAAWVGSLGVLGLSTCCIFFKCWPLWFMIISECARIADIGVCGVFCLTRDRDTMLCHQADAQLSAKERKYKAFSQYQELQKLFENWK